MLGLARSGLSTVETLLASGAEVTAWDNREEAREIVAGRATVADPLLGARVLVLDGPGPGAGSDVGGDGRIALAEPTTEGRLAAFLARHGEGPAGRYIGVGATVTAIATRAAAAGVSVSRAETGPFGPEVVVLGGRRGSPLLILVEVAAVPSKP